MNKMMGASVSHGYLPVYCNVKQNRVISIPYQKAVSDPCIAYCGSIQTYQFWVTKEENQNRHCTILCVVFIATSSKIS